MTFNEIMILLMIFFILFLIIIIILKKMRWYYVIRRMRFNILFFLLYWIHAVIILHNKFDLSTNILIYMSNVYIVVMKIILVKSYQQKLKLGIKEFEDFRI